MILASPNFILPKQSNLRKSYLKEQELNLIKHLNSKIKFQSVTAENFYFPKNYDKEEISKSDFVNENTYSDKDSKQNIISNDEKNIKRNLITESEFPNKNEVNNTQKTFSILNTEKKMQKKKKRDVKKTFYCMIFTFF